MINHDKSKNIPVGITIGLEKSSWNPSRPMNPAMFQPTYKIIIIGPINSLPGWHGFAPVLTAVNRLKVHHFWVPKRFAYKKTVFQSSTVKAYAEKWPFTVGKRRKNRLPPSPILRATPLACSTSKDHRPFLVPNGGVAFGTCLATWIELPWMCLYIYTYATEQATVIISHFLY